jgi:hypothetical protein
MLALPVRLLFTQGRQKDRGDCRLTISPSMFRLDASAGVLRLLEVPPVLTLLYVLKKSVLQSKVGLQTLIACVSIAIVLPAMPMQTLHGV